MEIFLLLLDELDDAAAVLRVWCAQLAGFFIACVAFVSSILAIMHWPMLAALLLVGAAIWAGSVVTHIRLPRFKTDP
jgi:fatty acid desaturase